MVDALVGLGRHGELARAELRGRTVLQVPTIFAAEATSARRGLVLRGAHPFEPLSSRIWELRDSLTVHDAWYGALAEWLGRDLVTADKRLAGANGPRCLIRDLATATRP